LPQGLASSGKGLGNRSDRRTRVCTDQDIRTEEKAVREEGSKLAGKVAGGLLLEKEKGKVYCCAKARMSHVKIVALWVACWSKSEPFEGTIKAF